MHLARWLAGLLMLGLVSVPLPASAASPQLALPGQPAHHFWAAASLDMRRHPTADAALAELRALYELEEQVLAEFQSIGGLRVYSPETSGKLWTVHEAIARRERRLGLQAEGWGLPEGAVAVSPINYPTVQPVLEALERIPTPAQAFVGLPVFLAPIYLPRAESWAISHGGPWLDEAVVLFSGVDAEAVLHELGHVVQRQVLAEDAGVAEYLEGRSHGNDLSGNPWRDSPAENFAEDFRMLAGGAVHRGAWGAPSQAHRDHLQALLSTSTAAPALAGVSLADSLAQRSWQPLTGLHFVTDEEQVRVDLAGAERRFHGEICGAGGCHLFEGTAPLSLPLPAVGQYQITVAAGADVWLEARVSRVRRTATSVATAEASPEGEFCVFLPRSLTAAALLTLAAEQQGWGAFPLPADRVLLGNGWDRHPAATAAVWARLTGTISPLFTWAYGPAETTPAALAHELLSDRCRAAGELPGGPFIRLSVFQASDGRIGSA